MHQLRFWLINYIEHAFRDVVLGEGRTLYEAEYQSSDGSDSRELERSQSAVRDNWRYVPIEDIYQRSEAIFFMDCHAKRYYSPAILRAILLEGYGNGSLYDCFIFDFSSLINRRKQNEADIPFAQLYDTAQRAAFVRFCKFAAYNAPREFGTKEPLRILKRISALPPAPRPRRGKRR